MQYLHTRQILHRDLKPDNVLIDANCTPKLADFGLSKVLEKGKNVTNDIGTLGWRAKEQIENGAVTKATDIFSLGCILFYYKTGGQHPFGGEAV